MSPGAGFGVPLECDAEGSCLYPGNVFCFAGDDDYCCFTHMIVDRLCCRNSTCRLVPEWVRPTMPDPPDPGEWEPPFDEGLLGEPGWRDSDEPLCMGSGEQVYMPSIWSDGRGVFVASTRWPSGFDPGICPDCVQHRIDFNAGDGWQEVEGIEQANAPLDFGQPLFITGFDGGPLVLYGGGLSDEMLCGLSLLDDGVRTCEPVHGVFDVHVVNDQLAYGVLQGSLIRYDGERWGPVPLQGQVPDTMLSVWADETVAMMTGMRTGAIYTLRDGVIQAESTRTLETFLMIFGFGPSDVWASTLQGGLFHYDGTDWTKIDVPASECGQPVIHGLWGENGTLYLVRDSAFMRWNGTAVEILAEVDCSHAGIAGFTGLWGNSEDEVFVGFRDESQRYAECGSGIVLWFDGSEFHRM